MPHIILQYPENDIDPRLIQLRAQLGEGVVALETEKFSEISDSQLDDFLDHLAGTHDL